MSYVGNTPDRQAFVPQVDYFSGNSVTTTFTLSRVVGSAYQVFVSVNSVGLTPGLAYTINGNQITFAVAPGNGSNNIWVQYTSVLTQTMLPADQSVTIQKMAPSAIGNSGADKLMQLDSLGNLTLGANNLNESQNGVASSTLFSGGVLNLDNTTGNYVVFSPSTFATVNSIVLSPGRHRTLVIGPTSQGTLVYSAGALVTPGAVSLPFLAGDIIGVRGENNGSNLVRVVGGMKASGAALYAVGSNQSWQNVTSSRAASTTYYNTTPAPISVSIIIASGIVALYVDGAIVSQCFEWDGRQGAVSVIIPPGSSYMFAGGFSRWSELR